jgi:ubiquinone/menaquinone biosynthesis C-methylase UbiE
LGDLKTIGGLAREEEMIEKRKEFFDRHAQHWDDRLQYEKKFSQLLEIVKGFELQEGYWVLDVGTGTGVLLPLLREVIGMKGKLFGMDFSFNMLDQAKKRRNAEEGVLINAGIGAIPIRSDRFDRVTCFSAFPHFPDKSRALLEMVRVLKSGGKLFIAHLHSVEEINQLHQGIGGPIVHDLLPHTERIRNLMRDSGLYEVSVINQPGKFLAKGKKI